MFLPMNVKEMKQRGWDAPDFIYVSGDSYVDHPSFGAAIITRVLEDCGCRVVFLSQPNWRSDADFTQFGKPRLGFMVSAGNIDSMVAHYTVAKRRRHDDAYTAGGKNGKRPDRAVTVYCNIIRRLYPDSPIIIGGLEASLRRFAHYDYWSDSVMPSILFDSRADILVYGMGELQTVEIAKRLAAGDPVEALHDLRGICYQVKTKDYVPQSALELPAFERVRDSKRDYATAARRELDEADAVRGRTLIQRHGDRLLVQNPSPTTAAASARAISARSPFIRGAPSPSAARRAWWRKRKALCGTSASRAISATSAVPRQISACRPVRSKKSSGCARAENVWRPSLARRCRSATRNIYICCAA